MTTAGAQERRILRLTKFSLVLATAFVFSNTGLAQQKQATAIPLPPAKTVQFVHGQSAVNIPFDFENNQIVLPVRVNDSPPLKFMFDTGAGGSLVSARKAAGLNLKRVGTVNVNGVGGESEAYLAGGISLGVSGVKVLNQTVAVMSLDNFPCDMRDIDGIIGYDFIKEFVIEINYEARTISLSEPSSYRYSGSGEVIPLIIRDTPFVHARVALPGKAAIEGLFEIDTGSDGSLSINSPFVRRHKLLDSLGTQVSNNESGLGSESERIDARLGTLQLGRFTLTAPIVGFSLATEGSIAAEDNDGPMGNQVLQRFKVIIDYSRQRMILEPNAHLADRFEADMSGIALDAEGEDCRTYKVAGVAEKSPASAAGILAGDEIVTVDGKPANQFTTARIERLLMQDGATHSLTLRRAGKIVAVRIKLRRLV